MSKQVKNTDTGQIMSMSRAMFEFHASEEGLEDIVSKSDEFIFVGIDDVVETSMASVVEEAKEEVPAETWDEEPIEEKPQGFFKTFTQKGVTE